MPKAPRSGGRRKAAVLDGSEHRGTPRDFPLREHPVGTIYASLEFDALPGEQIRGVWLVQKAGADVR
jgi:hypothetical protein